MIGIDLFAGAGGMSLGATMAGIDVKLAVEIDPWACLTYEYNHPETTVHKADIRSLTRRQLSSYIPEKDRLVIFGGPPCQGFSWSNARTRRPDNQDNWLFKEFLRIVRLCRPMWVVFENVQGIVDTAQGVFVTAIQTELKLMGYSTTSGRMNSADFGVPQDRTRFFLVGCRTASELRLPKPTDNTARPTVDDALRDLPPLINGNTECWKRYGRSKPSQYAMSMRNDLQGCNNHLVTRNSPAVIRRYEHIPPGGNWECIPKRLMKNYTDYSRCHTGIYYRLKSDAPSIVIGNYRKNMLIHPTQDRGLSVREAARIQSFPDHYKFFGSIGFQQQQVGNAVPPLLAKSVFATVLEVANGKRIKR